MTTSSPNEPVPSRVDVHRMFDRIAARYDTLNRLLSLRRDVYWRKRMAKFLPSGDGLKLVDVATGTGDQILFLMRESSRIQEATGVDLSEGMLDLGRAKVAQSPFAGRVAMEIGDALALPVQDASCDVATISFGIRNVLDVGKGLGEMHRVLRPGGRVLVLECSLPKFAPLRAAYLFYFRRVLPWVGGKVSGSADAYRYLNKTVETFPCGDDFCALMRTAGFEDVSFHPMTFGVATIYVGSKPG